MDTETDLPLYLSSTSDEGNVLPMILGGDDSLGRLSEGNDESEFDALPRNENEIETEVEDDVFAGADVFTPPPAEEKFPLFKAALRHFQSTAPKSRVVRIDSDETHNEFVCEKAVKELDRRVRELRAAMEEHQNAHSSEKHPGYHQPVKPMRQWEDVLGAAQAVADLRDVKNASEAVAKMPQVPIEIPSFAEGKVKCWRDGDYYICSMRFADAEGAAKIATMAMKPKTDSEALAKWAMKSGVEPTTALGALADCVDVAVGKKLVREVAGAALKARNRLDVCGVEDEPLLLTSTDMAPATNPSLAALMYVTDRAQKGDPQAKTEMSMIEAAASTPTGKKVAGPIIHEAKARLAAKRGGSKSTLAERYSLLAMGV